MPLSINDFREEKGADLKKLRESQTARNKPQTEIDTIIALDTQWRQVLFQMENKKRDLNKLNKDIGAKMKAKENADDLRTQAVALKAEIEQLEKDEQAVQAQANAALNKIGNFVHASVPRAVDEEKNEVVATWGETKHTGKELPHHQLIWMIDGFEPQRGVNIAGHRAYFLKGVGVLLNQALINYGLTFLRKAGYTALQPPYFMSKNIMAETAQLEDFDESLYKVSGEGKEEMYLIATSEQPISAYHRGESLDGSQLPIRYSGVSTCFRKEAGAHTRDTKGIFRIHQFEKVEQFVLTDPEKSWEEMDRMISQSKEFYQSLGLPYRVVNIVSGALNNAASKKLDLEAWFPGQNAFRELVSCSNCTDYQSRAMDTRFGLNRKNNAEVTYVHMLNATLTATERTICCILENYQTETGVKVPEVLIPFMGGIDFLPFTRTAESYPTLAQGKKAQAGKEAKEQQKTEGKKEAAPKKETPKKEPKKEAAPKKEEKDNKQEAPKQEKKESKKEQGKKQSKNKA